MRAGPQPLREENSKNAVSPAKVSFLSATMLGFVLVAANIRVPVTTIPPLLSRLGIGVTAQSLLVTIPVICFAAGAMAGAPLRRLLGEERTIFILLVVMAAALALRGAYFTRALFPATLVISLCLAVLNVHVPSLVKRRFPHQQGRTMGTYTTSMTLGAGVSAALALPVVSLAGGSIRFGLAFWAIPAVLAAIAWAPQLRVPKPLIPRTAGDKPAGIWSHALAWQVMAFMGLSSGIFYAVYSWLPELNASHGIERSTTGYLLLLMSLFGVLGSLGGPILAVRMRDQKVAVIATAAAQILGFLGLFLAPSLTILWCAIFGIGNGGTLSVSLLLIVLRAGDSHVAARLSIMCHFGGYVIAAAGPFVVGSLHSATGEWSLPMFFLIAMSLACFGVGLGAARGKQIHATAASNP
jgi:MFS transporter, CP family, cyanate transporter